MCYTYHSDLVRPYPNFIRKKKNDNKMKQVKSVSLKSYSFRDSYLRFSSQIFSLSNYHESVHLTNNAVQTKYKNNGDRDKALPDENMWDCHTFKAYLR